MSDCDVLIVGGSGQIGTCVKQKFLTEGYSVKTTGRSSGDVLLDLAALPSTDELVKQLPQPNFLILTAAMSAVDRCQTHPEESWQINVVGMKSLLDAFLPSQTKVIFISSDYVFDGQAGPYRVGDLVNPIQTYGYHKLVMEVHIREKFGDSAIVRTNMVYGEDSTKKNYSTQILERLRHDVPVTAQQDEQVTPTYNQDLALYIYELVAQDAHGTFHCAGTPTTRYQFAMDWAAGHGYDSSKVQSVLAFDLKRPAPRPLWGGLKTTPISNFTPRSHQEVLASLKK